MHARAQRQIIMAWGMHILTFEIREKLFHNYNMIAFTGGVEEAVTTGEKLALGGLNS